MIKMGQLIFYLVIYVHMKACIWYYVCRTHKKWLPPVFWEYPVSAEYTEQVFFTTGNHIQQYVVSVYYSVLMLKPNELGPRSNMETLICSIIIIIDLIVGANIYGSVAILVQMAGRRSAQF